jgi:hypothetical protein
MNVRKNLDLKLARLNDEVPLGKIKNNHKLNYKKKVKIAVAEATCHQTIHHQLANISHVTANLLVPGSKCHFQQHPKAPTFHSTLTTMSHPIINPKSYIQLPINFLFRYLIHRLCHPGTATNLARKAVAKI